MNFNRLKIQRNSLKFKRILIFILFFIFLVDITSADAKRLRWRLYHIRFTGFRSFKHTDLYNVMELKPLWSLKKIYFSETKLANDIESIRSFYFNQGFRNAIIKADSIKYDSLHKRVSVVLGINENERTVIRSLHLRSRQNVIDTSALKHLSSALDSPLITTRLNDDIITLRSLVGGLGYLCASVTYSIAIDPSKKLAGVTFQIVEGPLMRTGEIRVSGNKHVRPEVVLREVTFKKGDTLRINEIRKTERRLFRSGLFNFVSIDPVLGDTTNGLVYLPDSNYSVQITIDESNFFNIQTGFGYGTYEGLRASLQTSYNNLFALGHRITLNGKMSQMEQDAEVIYSTPWLMRFPLQFDGITYFNRYSDEKKYQGIFNGFRVQLGKQTDYFTTYRTWTDWKFVQWLTAPVDTNRPAGVPDKNTQSLGTDITIDTRNDLFNPSDGIYNRCEFEVAGLQKAESNQFYKWTNTFKVYYHYDKILYFATALHVGFIQPYGNSKMTGISPDEQFYGGGSRSVRGFEENQLLSLNGNAEGGNVILTTNIIDLRFPLFGWLYGSFFIDAGDVWESINDITGIQSTLRQGLRWTAGPGLRMYTPIAVFRSEIGFKLNRRLDEKPWVLHLDIGQPF